MTKICTLVIRLVEEADEKTCNEIADEIRDQLQEFLHIIPWAKEIEKIRVSEQ